jgi:hypothetical protein
MVNLSQQLFVEAMSLASQRASALDLSQSEQAKTFAIA